jgi:hypothetical protein
MVLSSLTGLGFFGMVNPAINGWAIFNPLFVVPVHRSVREFQRDSNPSAQG